jgi:Zn ribbon nucleic-acid-binding protein
MKTKKLVLIIVTVYAALLILSLFASIVIATISGTLFRGGLINALQSLPGAAFGLLFLIAPLGALAIWINSKIQRTRCVNCGTFRAYSVTESQRIGESEISTPQPIETRNARGEVTSTTVQYIPGTRIHYRDTYTCKSCGHSYDVDRSEDVAHI